MLLKSDQRGCPRVSIPIHHLKELSIRNTDRLEIPHPLPRPTPAAPITLLVPCLRFKILTTKTQHKTDLIHYGPLLSASKSMQSWPVNLHRGDQGYKPQAGFSLWALFLASSSGLVALPLTTLDPVAEKIWIICYTFLQSISLYLTIS